MFHVGVIEETSDMIVLTGRQIITFHMSGGCLCVRLWFSAETDGLRDRQTKGNPISPLHDKDATGDNKRWRAPDAWMLGHFHSKYRSSTRLVQVATKVILSWWNIYSLSCKSMFLQKESRHELLLGLCHAKWSLKAGVGVIPNAPTAPCQWGFLPDSHAYKLTISSYSKMIMKFGRDPLIICSFVEIRWKSREEIPNKQTDGKLFIEKIHSDEKKMLTHQGEFLVTRLHRQVPTACAWSGEHSTLALTC